uniref:Uncharacterized protein n=1 Tax=Ditylenchus dipsaci TaxID=166011 RepID=A0A915DTN2_9BILA
MIGDRIDVMAHGFRRPSGFDSDLVDGKFAAVADLQTKLAQLARGSQTRNFNPTHFRSREEEPLICQMQPVKSSRFVGNQLPSTSKASSSNLRKWPKLQRRAGDKEDKVVIAPPKTKKSAKLRRKESEVRVVTSNGSHVALPRYGYPSGVTPISGDVAR